MNPDSKTRLCADVFCTQDTNSTQDIFINGDFYCRGALTEVFSKDQDLTLEVFGDLYVDKLIYFSNVIVHGNLHCEGISCTNLIVLGDIFINGNHDSSTTFFVGELDSSQVYCDGNVSVTGTINSGTFIANGSVTATSINVDDILAGDMNVSKDISFMNEVFCTGHIKCSEFWSPNFIEDNLPKVHAKSIQSKNFAINC